jgi:hypothetical protein
MAVKRPSSKRKQTITYACNGESRDRHGCPSVSISSQNLDNAVWARVINILLQPEIIKCEVERRRADDTSADDLQAIDVRMQRLEKYRNLRDNPHVAISFSDLTRPDRYVELRGTVVEFELFDNLSWVNQLAHKYTGADFTHGKDGEHRYKVTIQVDSWTGQG